MDKKRKIELKPCPHCGGTDLQVDFNGVWERHFVRCYNHECHMQGPEVYGREQAAELWNNLPRALVWSSEPPKVPGYYWCRDDVNCFVGVVEAFEYRNGLCLFYPGNEVDEDIPAGCEWAGPIPEPGKLQNDQVQESGQDRMTPEEMLGVFRELRECRERQENIRQKR